MVAARVPWVGTDGFGPCRAPPRCAAIACSAAWFSTISRARPSRCRGRSIVPTGSGRRRSGAVRASVRRCRMPNPPTITPRRNKRARKLDEFLGFKVVGVVDRAYGNDDAVIYQMPRRGSCRWLKEQSHGKERRRVLTSPRSGPRSRQRRPARTPARPLRTRRRRTPTSMGRAGPDVQPGRQHGAGPCPTARAMTCRNGSNARRCRPTSKCWPTSRRNWGSVSTISPAIRSRGWPACSGDRSPRMSPACRRWCRRSPRVGDPEQRRSAALGHSAACPHRIRPHGGQHPIRCPGRNRFLHHGPGGAGCDPGTAAPGTRPQSGGARCAPANQGIDLGSEAYRTAQTIEQQRTNDARLAAVREGYALENQLYNQALAGGHFNNAAQQQDYGQQFGRGQFAHAGIGMNNQNALNAGNFANSAALNAAQFANAAQAQAFGQNQAQAQFNNQAAQQALQQTLALRNQPLNEISALMSGGQVSLPQFQGYNPAQVQGMPIGQYIYNTAGIQQQHYQQQQQNQNAMLAGLFGLASPACSGWRAVVSDGESVSPSADRTNANARHAFVQITRGAPFSGRIPPPPRAHAGTGRIEHVAHSEPMARCCAHGASLHGRTAHARPAGTATGCRSAVERNRCPGPTPATAAAHAAPPPKASPVRRRTPFSRS